MFGRLGRLLVRRARLVLAPGHLGELAQQVPFELVDACFGE
jgi:hypothetical protein